MKMLQGATLIELMIFIVIMAMVSASMLLAFQTSLSGEPGLESNEQAIGLARERMDLILGQRASVGALSLVDPCTANPQPTICVPYPGGKYNRSSYQVSATFSDDVSNGVTRGRIITVNVMNATGQVVTSLTTVAENY